MLPPDLQSPHSASPITYSKVLVVEGGDAFYFFKAALRHLGLGAEVEIRNSGGISDWSTYLPTLAITQGFERVTSLGVVRDAESDAAGAFASVCSALTKARLVVPTQPMLTAPGRPSVAVFILPDCRGPGMLETLCLQAAAGDPAMTCVERYFRCLRGRGVASPSNMEKARLHAFLASRQRPHLRLGQAAEAGYWDWSRPAFEPIMQFLAAL